MKICDTHAFLGNVIFQILTKKKNILLYYLPHKSEKKNKTYFINFLQQKAESDSLTHREMR